MNTLIEITEQTMSSREIAAMTNKRHDHVLRDCDKLNLHYEKMGFPKLGEGYYTLQSTGKQKHRQFELNRMQTFDLMTGYDAELRIKVNRRWEELESKAQTIDFSNPNIVLQLAQNWADEQKKRIEAENKVRKLQPKVEFLDKILDTDEKIDIGQAAKILELSFGRNTMFKELRERGIFFKNRNEPKQQYIDRGYFQLKEKFIERNNHDGFVVVKVLVTQKGLEFLSGIFNVSKKETKMALIN